MHSVNSTFKSLGSTNLHYFLSFFLKCKIYESHPFKLSPFRSQNTQSLNSTFKSLGSTNLHYFLFFFLKCKIYERHPIKLNFFSIWSNNVFFVEKNCNLPKSTVKKEKTKTRNRKNCKSTGSLKDLKKNRKIKRNPHHTHSKSFRLNLPMPPNRG